MSKYIDAEKLFAEIERREKIIRNSANQISDSEKKTYYSGCADALLELLPFITSLQQDPRFPLYDNIVEKVFGAGNLEGWERDEAEILVALAKEELLKSLQQEQPELPTIKGWIARDDADRLGLYDQKPTRKTELGAFSGTVHPWVIGDTWIGRFSLDQTAKTLFPNLCWTDDPMEVELIIKPIQEQHRKVDTKMRVCDKLEMEKLYGEE